jgi:FtsP/CotA-like multicopper oxidase with cupredoxin domain
MISRREFVQLGAAVGAGAFLPVGAIEKAMAFNLLGAAPPADPLRLKKYVDKLPLMPVMPTAGAAHYYEVGAFPMTTRVHRQMHPTKAWGYRPMGWHQGANPEATWLGPSFVARKGVPTRVKWFNQLVDAQGAPIPHPLPVDPSLDWAAPFGDNMMMGPFPVDGAGQSTFDYTLPAVPLVPHVHGAEVEPQSDGGPAGWFTPGWAQKGASWSHKIYQYANGQPESTIWYHDHTMGMTRLNVYMGLAGAYVVSDPAHSPKGLPKGVDHYGTPLDVPLVLQDRMFDTDGQLYFPAISNNPTVNPFWAPEFFGDHILVNGRAWPHLDVEPRAYRFRILNGSNARFYHLWLAYAPSPSHFGPAMHQIATDGGYLYRPVRLDPHAAMAGRLRIAPGERCEVVVDFSNYAGHKLRMYNQAPGPYPDGDAVDPRTTAQIMEFHVRKMPARHFVFPKNPLNPTLKRFPSLDARKVVKTRILTLNEVESPTGPLEVLLNLTRFGAPVSEQPVLGSMERWKIVNTTMDTHPMHLHLTQFQVESRQAFDDDTYGPAFAAQNGTTPFDGTTANDSGHMAYAPVDPTPHLEGVARQADANERGWKDTVRMSPGEVTTILVRFSPTDGSPSYGFDATAAPGYVWHCHIVDHEDNEMMRPYRLVEENDV